MKAIVEKTSCFEGTCSISESYKEPGMILVQTVTQELGTGAVSSAHIRLTRDQARELADELHRMADKLFFDSLNKSEE